MHLSFAFLTALAAVASAQTRPFTDDRSNITYQAWSNADNGLSMGWAIPMKTNDTLMGLITAPIKAGWVGVSFGGNMRNNLLLVAWNNKGNLTGDLRWATSFQMPKPYEGKTNPVLAPLPCASGFNDTHWFLAFACQNCNTWTNAAGTVRGGFDLMGASTKIGWAYSEQAPTNPDDPRSAIIKHNDAGKYTLDLKQSRSKDFAQWFEDCSADDDEDGAEDDGADDESDEEYDDDAESEGPDAGIATTGAIGQDSRAQVTPAQPQVTQSLPAKNQTVS